MYVQIIYEDKYHVDNGIYDHVDGVYKGHVIHGIKCVVGLLDLYLFF